MVAVLLTAVLAMGVGAGLAYWLLPGPAPDAAGPDGGGPGAGGPPQGPPPALVRLAPATMKTVQSRARIIGQLEAVREATVASEVEGRVIAVPVEPGDEVVAGTTVLAEIDAVFAELDLAAAEAEALAAEATLEKSESDLAELEALAQRDSATTKEVTDQRAQARADRARLDAAVASRDRAKESVQRLRVVAPFDGVIVEKHTEVGQWLEPGGAVVRLISRGEIDAVVDVPESHVNVLREGLAVGVLIEPLGQRVTGEVVAVNPSGSRAARTFPVEVRLDDAGGALKPGMSVIAEVPLSEEAERLTVPRDAVRFGEQGAQVWAAIPMGGPMPQALPLPVRMLFGSGDDFVVEGLDSAMGPPLSPGTPVVIEGGERLFPTQPLRAHGEGPPPGGAAPTPEASEAPAPQADAGPDAG